MYLWSYLTVSENMTLTLPRVVYVLLICVGVVVHPNIGSSGPWAISTFFLVTRNIFENSELLKWKYITSLKNCCEKLVFFFKYKDKFQWEYQL